MFNYNFIKGVFIFKKISQTFLISAVSSALFGCASIISGSEQSVTIDTGQDTGASCCLRNERGVWNLDSTPGCVNLKRSCSKLTVNYKKGCKQGTVTVDSSLNSYFFGNILAGGIIGAAVDSIRGQDLNIPTKLRFL